MRSERKGSSTWPYPPSRSCEGTLIECASQYIFRSTSALRSSRGFASCTAIAGRDPCLVLWLCACDSFARHNRIPNIYESHASIVISDPGNGNDDRLLSSPPLAALTQQMTSQGNLTAIAQRVVADLVSIFEQTNAAMRRQTATELEQFHSKISEVEKQLEEVAPQSDLALLRTEGGRYPDNASLSARAQRLAAANSIDSLKFGKVLAALRRWLTVLTGCAC